MSRKSLSESARIVRWVAILALLTLVGAFLISRLSLDVGPYVEVSRRTQPGGSALGEGVAAASVLFFAAALIQLIRLLGRLSSGDLFTPAVTRAFRSFAFWLMLSAIVTLAGPPLAALAASPVDGVHRVELPIDLRDVMFVIAGLVLFLVARMLDEAARLDAELKEIV